MPQLAIGCSGFSYDHWRGAFYPGGLPQEPQNDKGNLLSTTANAPCL